MPIRCDAMKIFPTSFLQKADEIGNLKKFPFETPISFTRFPLKA